MAIYRLRYKCGKNVLGHLNYINGEDKYSIKKEHIEFTETKNLPKNFKDINDFWETALVYERKNANIYREFEITLPKEFEKEKNKEIIDRFLEKTFNKDYVYNYSIHNPNGEQPHAHIMFCDRKLDGIEREKEKFFKRYNPKNLEEGGVKKDVTIKSKEYILKIRKDWEEHLNLYLESAGLEKVSAKTLKEQRNEAIKEGDLLKAEFLNRDPINIKKNLKYNKKSPENLDVDEVNDILNKREYLQDKQIYEEHKRILEQEKFKKKYNENKKESMYATMEEILENKEKIEKEIFRLTKKMEDKNLEFIVSDKLSGGKINKLKNENRSLFKKMKGTKNKEREEIKNKINKNNEYIDSFINANKEKIKDEMLKQKGKYMKVLKYKIQDKEIIDKIFQDRLREEKDNPKFKNLYKAYIERKDLRNEEIKNEQIILKNKNTIQDKLKEKDFKEVYNLKKSNNAVRKIINNIKNAKRSFDKSSRLNDKIIKHGKFILDEFKHLNWDEEYEVGQFER